MYQSVVARLDRLAQTNNLESLRSSLTGIEKESLRVADQGGISQNPHPSSFGSPLTHPFLTTDYSEALLETITPPMADRKAVLEYLRDIHAYVYEHLQDEIIWATSMPCVLAGETSIPIAQYGSSNLGMMKTIYRRGLGHRYSRVMQVIAGVHFNYSFSELFWTAYQDIEKEKSDLNVFKSARYFQLIRNLQRYGWIISYLYGASPAVCKTFFGSKPANMQEFDSTTYYEPYATSLRVGDIGYQNNKELGVGFKANYDDLQNYVASLKYATETACPKYQQYGIKVNGEYQQLSTSILQIENEYYSTVRPKQVVDSYEKPSVALLKRGVKYIELRSLDVNAYEPIGINQEQVYFIEAFVVFCLLQDSPKISEAEKYEIDSNQNLAAHQGRDPNLTLQNFGKPKALKTWAKEILTAMNPVCAALDAAHQGKHYSEALQQQRHIAAEPEATPSARILDEMRKNGEGFFYFALRKSIEHQQYFQTLKLTEQKQQAFQRIAAESLKKQYAIEVADNISLDTFLQNYFAQ